MFLNMNPFLRLPVAISKTRLYYIIGQSRNGDSAVTSPAHKCQTKA